MNEIRDYDPETSHPALTRSVFAALEGSRLRLDSPRNNVSRRAAYAERVHEAAFVKSRCFELAKSKVRWLCDFVIAICCSVTEAVVLFLMVHKPRKVKP